MAVDVSRSMLADDVRPSRLERAKLAALDLKQLAKADRLALVAFAGTAFLQCPLCTDDEVFRQSLNALDTKVIPQGGTAIAEAIRTALTAFKEKTDNYKVLVLFTDGEDHDGEAMNAARDAAKAGLRVFTIGVGTPNGELVSTVDEQGRRSFLKDSDGQAVKSRLNQPLLEEIAKATQGFYLHLAGADTMETLYKNGLALLPKTEFGGSQRQRFHERYQGFLALALLLLVIEWLLPERKPAAKTTPRPGAAPAAPLAAVLALCFLPFCAQAASPGSAQRKYDRKRYDAAQREYEKLADERPNDARLRFNAGAAAYQAGQFEDAVKHFNSVTVAPDVKLQQRAYYNLGDAQYRMGAGLDDSQKKMEQWQEAVQSYESALKLDPKDADAQFNAQLVKKRLEELKRQEEEKKKQDPKDDKDNKDQKDQKDQKDHKDQQQKDSKDQKQQDSQQKDQQQKEQQQREQEKKEQEKKEQQQKEQARKDQEKKDQEKKDQQQQQEQKGDPAEEKKEPEGSPMRKMEMTPQQAQRLLDLQKVEERPMIFAPQVKTNRQDRLFKDW